MLPSLYPLFYYGALQREYNAASIFGLSYCSPRRIQRHRSLDLVKPGLTGEPSEALLTASYQVV